MSGISYQGKSRFSFSRFGKRFDRFVGLVYTRCRVIEPPSAVLKSCTIGLLPSQALGIGLSVYGISNMDKCFAFWKDMIKAFDVWMFAGIELSAGVMIAHVGYGISARESVYTFFVVIFKKFTVLLSME